MKTKAKTGRSPRTYKYARTHVDRKTDIQTDRQADIAASAHSPRVSKSLLPVFSSCIGQSQNMARCHSQAKTIQNRN